jgi:hypothetical protein
MAHPDFVGTFHVNPVQNPVILDTAAVEIAGATRQVLGKGIAGVSFRAREKSIEVPAGG